VVCTVLNVFCVMTSFQIGGTYAKPVLFVPEVAIGAVGRIQVNHFVSLIQYCSCSFYLQFLVVQGLISIGFVCKFLAPIILVMYMDVVNKNVQYDTSRYFNVRSKADISQLNLLHGTDN